jgi:hypothetical protein
VRGILEVFSNAFSHYAMNSSECQPPDDEPDYTAPCLEIDLLVGSSSSNVVVVPNKTLPTSDSDALRATVIGSSSNDTDSEGTGGRLFMDYTLAEW